MKFSRLIICTFIILMMLGIEAPIKVSADTYSKTTTEASNDGMGDYTLSMDPDTGRVKVSDDNSASSSTEMSNFFLSRLSVVFTGLFGCAALVLLGYLIVYAVGLAKSGILSSPEEKKQALSKLITLCIAIAILGAFGVICGFAYNFFR